MIDDAKRIAALECGAGIRACQRDLEGGVRIFAAAGPTAEGKDKPVLTLGGSAVAVAEVIGGSSAGEILKADRADRPARMLPAARFPLTADRDAV